MAHKLCFYKLTLSCPGQQVHDLFRITVSYMLSVVFVKANTCYRLTTVAVILVNREFSLLNVFKWFKNIYKALGKHGVLYKNKSKEH